ncbi:MAG: helix-turn-helix transcriptional regulator [Bacteroidales bacterium]|jgi:hypothetical protein|nr:helix-turn-helix transcriptional regulator [Bacteroidales bacterium]
MNETENDLLRSVNYRIKKEMRKQKVIPTEFARRIGVSVSSITRMLSVDTCSVSRLQEYSEALNHNFFTELADELNINYPESDKVSQLKAEIKKLKNIIRDKDGEIKTLRSTITLISGNNTTDK